MYARFIREVKISSRRVNKRARKPLRLASLLSSLRLASLLSSLRLASLLSSLLLASLLLSLLRALLAPLLASLLSSLLCSLVPRPLVMPQAPWTPQAPQVS